MDYFDLILSSFHLHISSLGILRTSWSQAAAESSAAKRKEVMAKLIDFYGAAQHQPRDAGCIAVIACHIDPRKPAAEVSQT